MLTEEDRQFCIDVVVAGSHSSKYATFNIVEKIIAEGIEGDFAEAGVGGGGQIAIMDYALRKNGQSRTIHAFDSFQGIPKATAEDDEAQRVEYGLRAQGETLRSSGKLVATLDQFDANMKRWKVESHVKVHRGWFQQMPFRRLCDRWCYSGIHLALLRIDVDLVESVRVIMRTLYAFIQKGGYVLFDDWGLEDCATRRELRKWYSGPVTEVEGSPGTVWWRKPA